MGEATRICVSWATERLAEAATSMGALEAFGLRELARRAPLDMGEATRICVSWATERLAEAATSMGALEAFGLRELARRAPLPDAFARRNALSTQGRGGVINRPLARCVQCHTAGPGLHPSAPDVEGLLRREVRISFVGALGLLG
jgi:hypothetical protein